MTTAQTNTRCTICQKSNPKTQCQCCLEPLCKSCAQYVSEDTFKYLRPLPEALKHSIYCTVCFERDVAGPLADYEATVERAKDIMIFGIDQGKETRFIKRFEEPYKIIDGLDAQDVTMHMAFRAAHSGFNAVIDVNIKAEKIRDGSYQTTSYSGTGIAANILEGRLIKDRSFSTDPN